MNRVSQVEIVDNNIYYDMMIFNDTSSNVNLSFAEQREYPLFEDPTDSYKMSVIRFSTDVNLPTIIPQVAVQNNTDPNKLIYTFTMSFKTYDYQQNVIFVPQIKTASPPSILSPAIIENEYYWIYDAMSFINMLNTALVSCWNGLNTLVVAGGDVLPNTAPNIYLEMNPSSYLINLFADQNQYDNSLTNPIKLYMNTPLHSLLKAFSGLSYYGYNNLLGKDIQFTNIKNYNNLNVFSSGGVNYLVVYSEYSPVASWSPVNSVVITTSLPIVQTLTSAPNVIDSQFFSNYPVSNTEKQISDFIVETDLGQWNAGGRLTYTAQIYRYVNMLKAQPITNIQINFYWKSKRGAYYVFYLDSGGLANLKILFEKIK